MSNEVIMPALGMAQDTGLLVTWHKSPGDAVKVGDVLMDVETDKSTMEVEAQADGYLSNVSAVAGEHVPVGNVIATITVEKPSEVEISLSDATVEPSPPELDEIVPLPEVVASKVEMQKAEGVPLGGGKILASPKARRLAHESGLDFAALMRAGLPQPYRAQDVETFQSLPTQLATPAEDGATLAYGPSVSHIAARVPSTEFDAFVLRMAEEGRIHLEAHVIWASFASRAARASLGVDNFTVEIQDRTGATLMRLSNPDKSRLSAPIHAPDETRPSLIIRDLTGSAIVGLGLSADVAPAFSINVMESVFEIGFAFSETQIAAPDAMQMTTLFAEQLENPLLHLV